MKVAEDQACGISILRNFLVCLSFTINFYHGTYINMYIYAYISKVQNSSLKLLLDRASCAWPYPSLKLGSCRFNLLWLCCCCLSCRINEIISV